MLSDGETGDLIVASTFLNILYIFSRDTSFAKERESHKREKNLSAFQPLGITKYDVILGKQKTFVRLEVIMFLNSAVA